MYTFQDLLKKIRASANLTQEDLAKILEVSTVLITMIETGQKEVSRKFIENLAQKMDVHPSSITPFAFIEEDIDVNKLPETEKTMMKYGEKLQKYLIDQKAKNLKKYA